MRTALALLTLTVSIPAVAQTPLWTAKSVDPFRESFVDYLRQEGKLPESPATPETYLRRENFDAMRAEQTKQELERIAESQNANAKMAWVLSYYVQGLTDMYRATGDVAYLKDNLALLRQALAHTDEKLDRPRFDGVKSPAWGSSKYREGGEYCVHAVHTGMIAGSFLEFLSVAEPLHGEIGFEAGERDASLDELRRALEFHDDAWSPAEPGASTLRFRNEYVSSEGEIVPLNMYAALALAHYWYWRCTGNEHSHRRFVEAARYARARIPVFVSPHNGEYVRFWAYRPSLEPLDNPRPWEEAVALDGGEDLSHSGISVSFIIQMAKDDIVFDKSDLQMLKETMFQGFGRRRDGLLAANITGQYGNQAYKPLQVTNVGYWMELAEFYPEVWDRLLPYYLQYESPPRLVDFGILMRLSARRDADVP